MSNWYLSESESWYAPLRQDEPAEKTKKKKGRVWLKALIAAVLVLGLIVGTALLFPDDEEDSALGDGSGFGQYILPPEEDETLPDDFREFFDSYYSDVERDSSVINIKRASLPKNYSCTLAPAGEEMSLQELYRSSTQSIVAISGYVTGKMGYSWATGIILSEDGLVLTNTHVIADCDRATVTLGNNEVFEAKLVGADSISDIAVLKIEASGLTPAVFGDSGALEVGDRVAAIGNPLGEDFRLTLTDGIISGIERGINYKGHSMNLLQTNTAINDGNSGGPLYNMYGQVIGITNMKMMSSYSSIEGIGFAIPSATVAKIVNTLVREGAVVGRPAIGITVGVIPETARARYSGQLPEKGGLYISEVSDGSDAQKQGLKKGDIILNANGTEVSTTAELSVMKDRMEVGDTIRLTIWREGEIFEVDVMLVDTNDVYG